MRPQSRQGNKYNARTTLEQGIKFDSKKEAERYRRLKLLERQGYIRDLRRQPRYMLYGPNGQLTLPDRNGNHRRLFYRADFLYYDPATRRWRVEDVKGVDTQISRLKRALVEQAYGVKVEIVK